MAGGGGLNHAVLTALLAGAGAVAGMALGNAWIGIAFALLVSLVVSARRLHALRGWLSGEVSDAAVADLPGEAGEVVHMVKAERERLIGRCAESESRHTLLRDSLSALEEGIVILDAERRIEWCNPGAGRLLGLRYPEDRGQLIANLLRYPGFMEFLVSGDSGRAFEFTIPDVRALTLQVQAAVFGARNTVLFFRDITSLKRLETIRQDFVGNISHELRTPLTVIAGYVDTLGDLLDSDSPVIGKVLAQMRQQSVRMQNLLKDLLLLSRLESGDEPDSGTEESIAVRAMLESICENALAAGAGERSIALDCDPRLRFRAGREEIETVFSNLVYNAVKYTQPGGSIAVRFLPVADAVEFSVVDDGIGIDPVHIPRLTERFYRVDKGRSTERGGTGLGLAIVKHALLRLGGELHIDSRPGAGSTFRCVFPRERLSVAPADAALG